MLNDEGKNVLDYTEEIEPYQGYTIEWAATRSRSEPGKLMAHYRVRKDGEATFGASIANLQDSEGAARDKAFDFARAYVDEQIGAKG